jgi:hypothetical protein
MSDMLLREILEELRRLTGLMESRDDAHDEPLTRPAGVFLEKGERRDA